MTVTFTFSLGDIGILKIRPYTIKKLMMISNVSYLQCM